ncbi:sigma-70 family RNA polymerase sigma factor [Clostridium gasigenes]|uniref:sigma-70 family RNA polymerase sigma factor n=1 Tax=Clostridium gasigenes TaxID=94869 RepID=UPI001C0E201F|nr:sigma-70 family RNA polymerase sigma factor [Clostridium gasigenes]MBU3133209.1 sigma-70 family RNA polymerase sigma factor [Clostridium gasigenes]
MENILKFRTRSLVSKDNEGLEEDLIKKSIKGDYDAFGDLIKIHKDYLYKMAFVYVKDRDKSLDILQECIYIAFKSIKKLKEPKYFKTWITRILINISIRTLEKDSKLVYLEDDNHLINKSNKSNMEEKLDLYNAIDMLKREYRVVVIMKYFNDMTSVEISQILKIPESTIKTQLSRAKNKLKSILKEGYLDD